MDANGLDELLDTAQATQLGRVPLTAGDLGRASIDAFIAARSGSDQPGILSLSTAYLQAILERVRYKPGWDFSLYDGRHEGQHMVITTVVPDAYNPSETVTLDVHSMLPPQFSETQFLEWLLWRLRRIEIHECREFFHVDGQVYDDPHADGADQDR